MPQDIDGHDVKLSVSQTKNVMHEVSDRISQDAAVRMTYETEQAIKEKTRAAEIMANHAGRKTVREEDIRAIERIVGVFGGLADE